MDALSMIWPGGEHDFALGLGELRALQEASAAGPAEVLARLSSGAWRVEDVIGALRLGLVGGGMEGPAALKLVTAMAEERRVGNLVPFAIAALGHSLFGPEDDQPGKDAGAQPPAASGSSPKSTAQAPEWGSDPRMSTP